MRKITLINAAIIILAVIGFWASLNTSTPKKDTTAPVSQVTAEVEQEESTGVHEFDVMWTDDFYGYKTTISEIEVSGKEVRVYFTFKNETSNEYLNGVEWGSAVIDKNQIDANPFGSDEVGGTHLSNTERSGFVVYYLDDYPDLAKFNSIRLVWDLTNEDSFESKQYDITLDF